MRMLLYVLTNFAVMIVFGIVISIVLAILGIPSGSIGGLMVIALVFGFGGSFISLLLSKTMAKRAVGAEVIGRPSNETERWLVNTVKDLSDKAGIKMPEVAIYPALDINAFATGARRDASLVAVSTGLLNSMTKPEAEAVIAHEISHVANGDMVTMTLLQGIMNTFVIFLSRLIAQVAAGFLNNNREDDSGSSGSYAIYFLVSFVLEIVFGIAASVIIMWFSRYREFKADAGSASLVGKEKMIAALQKLKTSYEPEEKASIMAFCINGKPSAFAALFLSHPPLDRRIEALRNSEYLK